MFTIKVLKLSPQSILFPERGSLGEARGTRRKKRLAESEGSKNRVPAILINHKTMMSPAAPWPLLPNWLYDNMRPTKGAFIGAPVFAKKVG